MTRLVTKVTVTQTPRAVITRGPRSVTLTLFTNHHDAAERDTPISSYFLIFWIPVFQFHGVHIMLTKFGNLSDIWR